MPYLLPDPTPAVLEDDALIAAFQGMVAGITGVPGKLVRPRWQPEPPNQPDFQTNWIAMGISATDSDKFAYVRQIDDEHMEVQRDQWLTLLLSFYGPGGGNV